MAYRVLDSDSASSLAATLRPLELSGGGPSAARHAHRGIDSLPARLATLLAGPGPHVSPEATIHPTAVLGDYVAVLPGAHVGPHCYVRSCSVLFPGVHLGFAVELDCAVLFDDVQVHHTAMIGQSVVGSRANLAFGFVTATRRLDGRGVHFAVAPAERERATGRYHGAAVGSDVAVGVHVALMPGTTVEPGVIARPHRSLGGYVAAGRPAPTERREP